MPQEKIRLSVIVPAYNNAGDLRECLGALIGSSGPSVEIIVVDDTSTDDTPAVAARMGVRLLQMAKNSGPAAARNYGVRHAFGEILLFVDADVVIAPGLPDRVLQVFNQSPDIAAVFGSYDASPRADGIVSQFRNLLHHYVHQNGDVEASTFWAGCGAIRREAFAAMNGFDETRFPRPSIEDIELGYRLRRAGYRIVLDKTLQGTHLKRWTLASVLRTDIRQRAIPWSRLILESENAVNDLNVKHIQRISGVLAILACAFLVFGWLRVEFFALAALVFVTVVGLNGPLYGFFFRRKGLFFALACVPLHFLYFLYSTLSYLFVWGEHRLKAAVNQRSAR